MRVSDTLSVDDKYLPEVAVQKHTLYEQIVEGKKIVWRYAMEAQAAAVVGESAPIDEAIVNIPRLIKKIDFQQELLDSLEA